MLNKCKIITFTIVAILLVSCSDRSVVESDYTQVYYNKSIAVTNGYHALKLGNSMVLVYSIGFERVGVHDGGKRRTFYLEVPSTWNLPTGTYPVSSSKFKAMLVERADPGGYKLYKQSELTGNVIVENYVQGKSLRIRL